MILSAGNAMTMTVMERVREIGTLRALGTGRLRIMGMFIAEGLGLGVVGGSLGLALAAVLATACRTPASSCLPRRRSRPDSRCGSMSSGALRSVLVVMIATVGIAAVLPAARAARLRITDALGHV